MRISIFSDNVAPYRMAWAEELAKNNDVSFVYTKDKDAERNDEWLVKKSNLVSMVKLPALVIRNKAITLSILKYIRNNNFDVLVFDGYGVFPNILAMLYLRYKKRIYFINIDGIRIGANNSKLKERLKRKLFIPYARLLCGSDYSAKHFISTGVNPEYICVHHFSSLHQKDIIDRPLSQYEKNNYKQKLNLSARKMVLAVGRFLALKQFDMLIRAFAPLDTKYQLVIIGEGDQKEVYQRIIDEKALKNVIIKEFLPYEKLTEYYKAADLFTLTSNSEVWGLVINEAMSFGLPVIATDRCVASYSLIKGNGFIIHYDNEESLTKQIDEILSDDIARGRMSIVSLDLIRDYTLERMSYEHIAFFKKNSC